MGPHTYCRGAHYRTRHLGEGGGGGDHTSLPLHGARHRRRSQMSPTQFDRRTVLKTLGITAAGGLGLTGTASAHPVGQNGDGNTPVFPTWGDGEIWEMLDAEPEDRTQDSEGSDPAHSPLYVIGSLAETGIDGSDHSPQFGTVDQVVPVPGGAAATQYSAQWHVHSVIDDATGGLATTDHKGAYLTSASRIQNAENVSIVGSEMVFTCPVRPHHG